jgi:hypothetical protein
MAPPTKIPNQFMALMAQAEANIKASKLSWFLRCDKAFDGYGFVENVKLTPHVARITKGRAGSE